MDGSWVAFGGAILALVGTVAVSIVNWFALIKTSKLQMEQARLSVSAASSLALMTQQAERAAAFFSSIEQLDRLTQSPDFQLDRIRLVAERVNVESALLQPFLTQELARCVMALARSFDALVAANSIDEIKAAMATMKARRSEFLLTYFADRKILADTARPMTAGRA